MSDERPRLVPRSDEGPPSGGKCPPDPDPDAGRAAWRVTGLD